MRDLPIGRLTPYPLDELRDLSPARTDAGDAARLVTGDGRAFVLLLPPVICRALFIAARRCPRCGYDVRVTPGRCPECGGAAVRTPA